MWQCGNPFIFILGKQNHHTLRSLHRSPLDCASPKESCGLRDKTKLRSNLKNTKQKYNLSNLDKITLCVLSTGVLWTAPLREKKQMSSTFKAQKVISIIFP